MNINNDAMQLSLWTFPKYFHIYSNNFPSPQSLGNNKISVVVLQFTRQKPWKVQLFSCHTMCHLILSKYPLIQELHGPLAIQSPCSLVPAPIYLLEP